MDTYQSWADPNVWYASWQEKVAKVFFDGEEANPAEEILGDVNSQGDWCYDESSKSLYVYSDDNPNLAFGEVRTNGEKDTFLINNINNIIVDGIDLTKGGNCLVVWGSSKNIVVKNLEASFSGPGQGVLVGQTVDDVLIENVKARKNGIDDHSHGFYIQNQIRNAVVLRNCEAFENYGYGFHIYGSNGATLERCIWHDNLYPDVLIGNLPSGALIFMRSWQKT